MANETDKQIDDLRRAADDSQITVWVDSKVRSVGNPSGAAQDMPEYRRGVIAGHSDYAERVGSWAGKIREDDSSPTG